MSDFEYLLAHLLIFCLNTSEIPPFTAAGESQIGTSCNHCNIIFSFMRSETLKTTKTNKQTKIQEVGMKLHVQRQVD